MAKKSKVIESNLSEFLQIKNFTSESADLHFYGDIVHSEWYAWEEEDKYPTQVKDFLSEHEGKALNIYINSGGGSVFAGLSIYNMLKRHTGFKTVYVDGLAGSIASVIMMAGDKIVVPANAFTMIHKPLLGLFGSYNATKLSEMVGTLDRIQEGIVNVYKEKLKDGVSIDTVIEMVNAETWLTGEQTAEYFNIELGDTLEAVASTGEYINSCKDIPEAFKNKPVASNEKAEAEARIALLRLKNKLVKEV